MLYYMQNGRTWEGTAMYRILVLEDDDLTCQLLEDALPLGLDCCVVTSPDGLVLLEMASTQAPDLIVLDVQVPGFDGIDTYRRLRAQTTTATIPVMFVTAGIAALQHALLDGRFSVLEKPFGLQSLYECVNATLAGQYFAPPRSVWT
jgi:CheY-like chemotaxis protein